MARKPTSVRPPKAAIEYENLDITPVYVEAAQGMVTPKGVLHVSFFNEFVKSRDKLESEASLNRDDGHVKMTLKTKDPFGSDDGNIQIVRRVEANLIFTEAGLKSLIPWLQEKLAELVHHRESASNAPTSE